MQQPYDRDYERGYFVLSKLQIFTLACFSLFVASMLLHPLFHGAFWIIDDHEIVHFKRIYDDQTGNLFKGFWVILQSTEVFNEASRFRPVYYSVRIIKSIILGTNDSLWFTYNFIVYLSCSIAFGLAIARRFPFPFAFFSVASLALFRFNFDLWPRLGPSEIEAMLGFFLATVGLAWHNTGHKQRWTWGAMCLGTTIAIGCKENFLLMLFPLLLVFFFDWKHRRLSVFNVLWILIVGSVSVPVITLITSLKKDVYMQSMGSSRYSLTIEFFKQPEIMLIIMALLFYYSISFYLLFRENDCKCKEIFQSKKGHYLLYSLLAMITFIIFAVGNYVVYSGAIRADSRYAFPYSLMPLFAGLALIYSLIPYFHRTLITASRRAFIYTCFVIITALLLYNVPHSSNVIAEQISKTQAFEEFRVKAQPYDNIVIFNSRPSVIEIYEPYFSLTRYARAGMLPKPYIYPLFPDNTKAGLESLLIKGLKDAANTEPMPTISNKTLLVRVDGTNFKKLEHNNHIRHADTIATEPFLKVTKQGHLVLTEDTTLFLPYNFDLTQFKISLNSALALDENSHTFIIRCNGKDISNYDIDPSEKRLSFFVEKEILDHQKTPQLITLVFNMFEEINGKRVYSAFELISLSLE